MQVLDELRSNTIRKIPARTREVARFDNGTSHPHPIHFPVMQPATEYGSDGGGRYGTHDKQNNQCRYCSDGPFNQQNHHRPEWNPDICNDNFTPIISHASSLLGLSVIIVGAVWRRDTYFDLFASERRAIEQLLDSQRVEITAEDHNVGGFNTGISAGEVAGQTVMPCHVHLIPRRAGDVSNPRGGVRHTIPGKGNY